MHTLRRARGFTLIELMTVAAIIAILAAVALPSYRQHVAKARRADARTALLQAAQHMQRFYAANDRYDRDRADNAVTGSLPLNARVSPADGTALYQLSPTISAPGDATIAVTMAAYTLTMAPIAGRAMANDACGRYTLSSTGVRGNLSAAGAQLPAAQREQCWR